MDPRASLDACLAQALSEHTPDAILATGDLAHDPVRDVYLDFMAVIRARTDAPLLCLPGNHDVLGVMAAVDMPLEPLDLAPWQIVPLDSHEDELPRALVTDADRAQTAAHLQASSNPYTLLATHHPLMALNMPWLDKDRVKNPEELVHWLAERSTSLRGIVFGHAHQACEGSCAGIPIYGVPATCFQFQPETEAFTPNNLPPGYRWLELTDDGEIATEVRRVAAFTERVTLPDHLK